MGIGTNLKLALKEYDLTVAELSRKTGISTNTFYAMIRRDNNKISPEMLKKICDNTDITVYDLLDNYDELAAKYYDLKATKEEQIIGDYILTAIGNDNNLEHIIEIYNKLNNTGKNAAYEQLSELEKNPQFTNPASNSDIRKYDGSIRVNMNKQRPFDIAIQKYQNGEELTEKEEQAIIEYVESDQLAKETEKLKQIAQKAYNYVLYMHSNSYASSEEEFNKLQKERQIENEPKKHNNVHKYDGSIRVDVSSSIKAQEIENKIKNNETISKEELSWLNDYRSSHNLKEGLGKLALSLDGVIKSLSDSMAILYDQLNENGQEKVFEYAKDLTQIPEYQKKPPEPPQD